MSHPDKPDDPGNPQNPSSLPTQLTPAPTQAAPVSSSASLETQVSQGAPQPGIAPAGSSNDLAKRFDQAVRDYRLIRLLGEGGMGAVYLAEQDNPRREVAIKLIHANLATPEMLARFEREGQVLGRLRHVGIAQIFTAGKAQIGDSSVPYLVMEYVEGETLLNYARERNLSMRERIGLLANICDALEHAHQRGVIHRDIKPANILVTPEGQPKVLDFGVARLNDMEDGNAKPEEQLTTAGFVVGTLHYMSPEQTTGDVDDLDIRSDVYALGVVGFQLLSGVLPYELNQRDPYAAVKTIRETTPTKLGSLVPAARGDVEIIIGKALEKSRERRYSGAGLFAEDLRLFLANQSIRARPPSLGYQLAKFVRRNRAVSAAIVLTIVSIVGALFAVSSFAMREQEARLVSEQQMQRTYKTVGFLKELLSQANPAFAQGRDVSVLNAVKHASSSMMSGLNDEPAVAIEVHTVLADTLLNLGMSQDADVEYGKALELARKHFAPLSTERLNAELAYALSLSRQGRIRDARDELARLMPLIKPRIAAADGSWEAELSLIQADIALGSQHDYAPRVAALVGEMQKSKPTPYNLLSQAETLQVGFLLDAGKLQDALDLNKRLYQQNAKNLGALSPETITTADTYASLLAESGNTEKAMQLTKDTYLAASKVLGPFHPDTLITQNNLARLMLGLGDAENARLEFEKIIDACQTKQDAFQACSAARTNLSGLYFNQGKIEQALQQAVLARSNSISLYGNSHPSTLDAERNLAAIQTFSGDFTSAGQTYGQLLEGTRARFGETHEKYFNAESEYAAYLRDAGQLERSLKVYASLLPKIEKHLGPKHPQTLRTLYQYSGALHQAKMFDRALPLTKSLLENAKPVLGENDPFTLLAPLRHARSLIGAGQLDQAEPLLAGSWKQMNSMDISPEWKSWIADAYVEIWQARKNTQEANKWRAISKKLNAEAVASR